MLLKRLLPMVFAALLLWGCAKSGDEKRVAELLDAQANQTRQMSQMSKRIDSVDAKLTSIEKSVNALLGASAVGGPEGAAQLKVKSDFAETKEYQDIMSEIALLNERVGGVQEGFTGFQEEQREIRGREALRDRGAAWRAMGDPKELSRRMDILATNFSGKIADPTTRTQFVQEVENLKGKYSAAVSPQEKEAEARALLTEAINAAESDRARGWMERQLQSLDEANPQELEERVNRVVQMQRMREIGELARKYEIPAETMRDSGLISFGGPGGPPGFMPGGGGGGAGGGRRGPRGGR